MPFDFCVGSLFKLRRAPASVRFLNSSAVQGVEAESLVRECCTRGHVWNYYHVSRRYLVPDRRL
jgi:hypothetical protein